MSKNKDCVLEQKVGGREHECIQKRPMQKLRLIYAFGKFTNIRFKTCIQYMDDCDACTIVTESVRTPLYLKVD